MPEADYTTPHPLTVRQAGEHYGCHNRKPYLDEYKTSNGETIKNANSKECHHVPDQRCGACIWGE